MIFLRNCWKSLWEGDHWNGMGKESWVEAVEMTGDTPAVRMSLAQLNWNTHSCICSRWFLEIIRVKGMVLCVILMRDFLSRYKIVSGSGNSTNGMLACSWSMKQPTALASTRKCKWRESCCHWSVPGKKPKMQTEDNIPKWKGLFTNIYNSAIVTWTFCRESWETNNEQWSSHLHWLAACVKAASTSQKPSQQLLLRKTQSTNTGHRIMTL